MAAAGKEGQIEAAQEFVYRISTADEWEELRNSGYVFGGELDKTSGFIHLSDLHQVQSTLQNFFLNAKADLYLLQIDAKKLGDGLIYELVDGCNRFPHFYGPSRSFSPLPLSAVTKAEKLLLSGLDNQISSPRRYEPLIVWTSSYLNAGSAAGLHHCTSFLMQAIESFVTDQSSTPTSKERRLCDPN